MKRLNANTLLVAIALVLGMLIFQLFRESNYFPNEHDYGCNYDQIELVTEEGRTFVENWIEKRYNAEYPIIDFDGIDDECTYKVEDDEKLIIATVYVSWEKGMLPRKRYEVMGYLEITPAHGFLRKYEMNFSVPYPVKSQSIVGEVAAGVGQTFKETVRDFFGELFK